MKTPTFFPLFFVSFVCFVVMSLPARADDFFESKVRPLLVERCHNCHSSKKQKGDLRLDSRAAILKGGQSGPAAVPGEPDKSRLIEAVRYTHADLQMPPKNRLSEKDVAILEEWVRRGLPYPNAGESGSIKAAPNLAEGRKWWSFQPLRRTAPPAVRNRDLAAPRHRSVHPRGVGET